MVVTFIGHATLYDTESIRLHLKKEIKSILAKKENVTFYCGGYGDFDFLCGRVLFELKNEGYIFESYYITPYLTDKHLSDEHFLKYYDGTIYPPLETTPPRFAIIKRNEWMVDKSDLVFCYVTHSFGGAAKTRAYAIKRKKEIVDLV